MQRQQPKFSVPERLDSKKGHHYLVSKLLGQGAYALVFSGDEIDEFTTTTTKRKVAIKMIRLDRDHLKNDGRNNSIDSIRLLAQREIDIMYRIRSHRNLLKIYEHFESNDCIFIILELCTNRTLGSLIKNNRIVISKTSIKRFILDIASGCDWLHSNLIVHRDIKPDNILLDDKFQAKIGDFGFSVHLQTIDELLFKFCGTLKYQAPEMFTRNGYSFPVDCWAVGCIVYYLFYGHSPFNGQSSREVIDSIINNKLHYSNAIRNDQMISDDEIKVIDSLLSKDPNKRMKMECLLRKKEFFFEIEIPSLLKSTPSTPSSINQDQYLRYKMLTEMRYKKMIECLTKISKLSYNNENSIQNTLMKSSNQIKQARINYRQSHCPSLVPKYWIEKWIEIQIFGFGYSIKTARLFVFNFNDRSRMFKQSGLIYYIDKDDLFHREKESMTIFNSFECPESLRKKFNVLRKAIKILKPSNLNRNENIEYDINEIDVDKNNSLDDYDYDHDVDEDYRGDHREPFKRKVENASTIQQSPSNRINEKHFPWLSKWIRTFQVIIFEFENKLIQINFSNYQKNLLFDPTNFSMTTMNLMSKQLLCLDLRHLETEPSLISEKMQQYISIALQYLNLLD
ncbi:DNA-directed RNA polymerase [Sarcoptes scabiei]|nr:DNA-directed RNA polymerase [Sarcoptes scabiei]